jgi:PIN domain nuclease of toxin-antitoxin system
VKQRLKDLHARLLPVELAHVDRIQDLPNHHRDPFDRLIVAQALSENLTLVSLDQKLGAYGVSII